ncbi:MAG: transglycosylase domain-containing protein, partial [Alphaproteobacteria bacterium]|nr:transglycosylase domain-containing protein [Alphaproteobacteria bacterium]
MRKHRRSDRVAKILGRGTAAAAGLLVLAVGAFELQTSWLQSELFSSIGQELTYDVEDGRHRHAYRPKTGPHDRRLGYVDLDAFAERLEPRGFDLTRQAGLSPRHWQFVQAGGYPIFKEKNRAGLKLLDHKGEVIHDARFPTRIYPAFEAIPPLVLNTLLFIENRELLEPLAVRRNPAVDWSRLGALLPGLAMQMIDPGHNTAGGSTLATQIEKFRHSPNGQTQGTKDKLRQMVSASLRAYRDGVDTTQHRRQVALAYINGTPLSARRGFGEINGIGDGLYTWFGADFDRVNDLLTKDVDNLFDLFQKANAYKQVLALLIAQRRPSHYLITGRAELQALCDQHLRLLMREGIVDQALGEAALGIDLRFLDELPTTESASHLGRKAATAIRTELLSMLGMSDLYALDRLDLTLESSIDVDAQRQVTDLLESLHDPNAARALGLYGHRLLQPDASNDPLVISLTVYERGDDASYLRVQADNLDQPFDINRGAKLDLGSTAKLRTLISYLEVIAELHANFAENDFEGLADAAASGPDALTRWAAAALQVATDKSLPALLDAAMAKRYSASNRQRFRTGGGLHHFANFDERDNQRIVTVAEAMRHSINLPLIRMMREIVDYHLGEHGDAVLNDRRHPERKDYLERFADREAMTYLRRFHRELAHLDGDQALAAMVGKIRPTHHRLSALFRFVRPEASKDAFIAFLRDHPATANLSMARLNELFSDYDPEQFSFEDQAFLVRLHPLELWLARHLQNARAPSVADAWEACGEAKVASAAWLFKTRRKQVQDVRIKQMLEEDAFKVIHQRWARLGYPFPSLVPSLASAIGSSADRPEALATLVGIIQNDGVLQPATRIQALHFAAGTPYETRFERRLQPSVRVMATAIAGVVRQTLVDVVENGTARRLNGGFDLASGARVEIGAKTGTGDHRKKTF